MQSKIFIASSSGALIYARQLAELLKLDKNLYPVVWDEGGVVFKISEAYIESLVDALSEFDFAIVLFHPDDKAAIKGDEIAITRDNVIFEYGLFIGNHGRERCYVVQPNNIDLRIPSDLLGVHNATYEYIQTDDPAIVQPLLKKATEIIKRRIKEVNQRKRVPPSNIQIINSYIHLATTQRTIFSMLEDCIRDGITLPEEILYWSVESANAWLNYEQETFESANGPLARATKFINKETLYSQLNFVSLGCGSGAKDILMMNRLSPDKRKVSYYPIDQSYTLLENAITETLSNINAEELYVSGIRADFRKIPSFQRVFKKKNTRTIYSLLGCTLGNYNEVSLLDSIRFCMEPGDFLVLEVGALGEELKLHKTGDVIDSGKYADWKLQDFLLSPIKPFVKQFTRQSLSFIMETEKVVVKNSVRVIVRFDNKDLPNQNPFDIAFSTHYPRKELIHFLQVELDLKTVYQETHFRNIYLVCQKPY